MRNVPSPDWLQRKLEASGLRSRDIVVDVTNLVLLELGQPLHAFDLRQLRGAEVRVRRARAGEKLATLDGETRELDPRDLVIADAERAIALAGVMGGRETEVSAATTDVLIESAHFAADRRAAHGPAPRPPERGVVSLRARRRSRGRAPRGRPRGAPARRAGGRRGGRGDGRGPRRAGAPAARDPSSSWRARTTCSARASRSPRRPRCSRGSDVAAREAKPGTLSCRPPSHRNDLRIAEDLAEELARIHGVDKIETTLPVGTLAPVGLPRLWSLGERARDGLVAAGLFECVCFPFVPDGDGERLGLGPDDPRRRTLRVVNPVKEEEGRLRSTLVPSLLRLARQNLDRQVDPVADLRGEPRLPSAGGARAAGRAALARGPADRSPAEAARGRRPSRRRSSSSSRASQKGF